MRVIMTYCDCCGKELSRTDNDDDVFVTMTIGKTGDSHFCFECARQLLDVWWKTARKIKGEPIK